MKINTLSLLQTTVLLAIFAGFIALFATAPAFVEAKEANTDRGDRVFVLFDKPVGNTERGLVRAFGGDIKYSYSVVDAVAAELPQEAIDGLLRNPHVLAIEPDGQVEATDIELDNSWGVKHISAGDVHTSAIPNKGTGVKIGIIDSGVNYLHSDLNDNFDPIDLGYDFYYYDDDPMDVYGHGTHVAGTACAEDNGNGNTDPKLGVVGVSPECELYSLRVLNDDGVGYWSDIIAAVDYSTGNPVYLPSYWSEDVGAPEEPIQGPKLDVINLSLGKDADPGTIVEQAFDNAYNNHGLVIVAAAGNSGNKGGKNESAIYPAKFDSVIAVAATDSNDNRATFSSTGADVELAAPGVDVYSAWNDDTPYYGTSVCDGPVDDLNGDGHPEGDCYKDGSGTSMASPHVAGTAALVIAAGITDNNGNGFINDDVRALLQNTATDLGSTGRDIQYGYGLVNALLAVQSIGGDFNNPPTADAGADQSVTDSDGSGDEQVTLDGSGSSDSDGSIASYNWYESGALIASGETADVTFPLGEHTITLTVTDDDGATDDDTVVISVTEDSSGEENKCPPGWARQGICTP